MTLMLLALLTFLIGASLTRLVTVDALIEGLRDRWTVHFTYRQDRILAMVNSRNQIQDVAVAAYLAQLAAQGRTRRRDELTAADVRVAMLHEIGDRAEAEPSAPGWLSGHRRNQLRPWSSISSKLIRLRGWMEFISCPWCVGFWVFLGTGVLMWGRVFAFGVVSEATVNWGAWDVWLIGGALAARWVYGAIAAQLNI